MTRDEYHALDAIGSTDLRLLARSPAHFRAGRDEPRRVTDAMAFGTMVHTYVLEPEVAGKLWHVESIDRRTKVGKERAAEVAQSGLTIVDPDEFETIARIRDSVMRHPAARRLLDGAIVESPVSWEDDVTGVRCKALPDARKAKLCIDLKTTEDASPRGFERAVASYSLHLQAAHYSAAPLGFDAFVFVAVEKVAPFAVGAYVLDAAGIARAEHRRAELLDLYATCQREARWPAYADTIQTINVPPWAA